MVRTLRWVALFSVLLGWASVAGAQEAAPTLLDPKLLEPQTDWYGLYFNKKKMGYCKTSRERVDAGIRESFTLVMKLTSFNQKAELSLTQSLVFEAKPPYRLMRGDFLQNDGKSTVKMTLTRAGEGFKLVHEAGGEVKEKDQGPIDYTLVDATATERWLRKGPEEGAENKSKDFSLQELKIEPQTSKIKSIKKSLVAGVPVKYYEVDSETKQLTMLSRFDDKGRMLSGKFFLFDILLEPEDQAKDTSYSQDLFLLGLVKIDRPLGKTSDVRELIVEVAGLESEIFEDGPRQNFVAGAKGKGTLKLGKKYGKVEKVSDKEVQENLEETLAYPVTHPKVKALAEEAVGDATTPEEKVKRIVAFVHGFVEPNLSATLPNIHALMKHKKGDCKSYALMTTTLARAAGVPSREVSGLLYIGDSGEAFGGHAWNEVVLGGVWVPVDASMGETEVDATHVSFGTQDRAAKGLLESLGKLSFRLVEVRTGR